MSKFQSLQQQIDDDALKILRYKFPRGFIFREPEKDYGIDCELEQFEEIFGSSLRKSTGVLFKGQVKGVENAEKLKLKTKSVISKSFEMCDLEYWFEQLKITVIIFLVNLNDETIYWTEFYSNNKLRADYREAQKSNKSSIKIHFPISNTIPATVEQLLIAVKNSREHIALSMLPSTQSIVQHLSEVVDIEREIAKIDEKRELAYYYRFQKYLDRKEFEIAVEKAIEILESGNFSALSKLYTVISCGRLVYTGKIQHKDYEDPFLNVIGWQLFAFDKYIGISDETPLLVNSAFDLMNCLFGIRFLGNEIFNSRVTAEVFGSSQKNLIAILGKNEAIAKDILLYGILQNVISEYNQILMQIKDTYVLLRTLSLIIPQLAQSFLSLRAAFVVNGQIEKLNELNNFVMGQLKSHAQIAELLNDDYLMHQCLVATFSLISQPGDEKVFTEFAEEIVSNINNPEMKSKAWAHFGDLSKFFGNILNRDKVSDIEMQRQVSIKLASMHGFDLTKDSDEIGYEDETSQMIHDVLRHAIKELDLTNYLKDCKHRHIFKAPFSGVSQVADAYGLGFASSFKSIVCLKKQVFSQSVYREIKKTFEAFHEKYCQNCSESTPHNDEWIYSLDWQNKQEKDYQKLKGN